MARILIVFSSLFGANAELARQVFTQLRADDCADPLLSYAGARLAEQLASEDAPSNRAALLV